MNELLKKAIDAHGGLERWSKLKTGTAIIKNGGILWGMKHQQEYAEQPTKIKVDLHRQKTSLQPFLKPNQKMSMEPDRVTIETLDGKVLEERKNPRESFKGHVLETPWDQLQLVYFTGYAMWSYLTAPFLLSTPGFEVQESEPWNEKGETWRGLKVRFPKNLAIHAVEQIYYFDSTGLLRRHDYDVDIAKGARGAHYMSDLKAVNGVVVPHQHRIYIPGPDNRPMPEPLVVSVDLSDVRFFTWRFCRPSHCTRTTHSCTQNDPSRNFP